MNACYDIKENQGAFRIDESLNQNTGLQIDCKIIDELNIKNVGYIKIDVEGHEYETLLGLKNTLITQQPVIFIEIHDDSASKDQTFSLLKELGYVNYYKLTHCDYLFPK